MSPAETPRTPVCSGAGVAPEALARSSWYALGHTKPSFGVRVASGAARLHGCFERAHGGLRRASGGASVDVANGTIHVALGLPSPGHLLPDEAGPWDGARVLNRYVRPLLRALTRPPAVAHYFGRDWVSLARRPVASIGFAHLAETGQTVVEAFVGVHTPFASGPRPSYRGAEPASIDVVTGELQDPWRLAARIDTSFRRAFVELQDVGCAPETAPLPPAVIARFGPTPWEVEPPPETFTAECTFEEALGPVTVGRTDSGVVQICGEVMVSLDAWHACKRALEASMDAGAIESTLAQPGVLLFGWRSFDGLKAAARGLSSSRPARCL